jgi:hypothetical protein
MLMGIDDREHGLSLLSKSAAVDKQADWVDTHPWVGWSSLSPLGKKGAIMPGAQSDVEATEKIRARFARISSI